MALVSPILLLETSLTRVEQSAGLWFAEGSLCRGMAPKREIFLNAGRRRRSRLVGARGERGLRVLRQQTRTLQRLRWRDARSVSTASAAARSRARATRDAGSAATCGARRGLTHAAAAGRRRPPADRHRHADTRSGARAQRVRRGGSKGAPRSRGRAAARVLGGLVSGITGIRINRVSIYRNHRLPAHIHAVVEQVLLTLHRSHPIARVSLM